MSRLIQQQAIRYMGPGLDFPYSTRVIVTGGLDRFGDKISHAETYELGSKSWKVWPSMVKKRANHSLAKKGDKIYSYDATGGTDEKTSVRNPSWSLDRLKGILKRVTSPATGFFNKSAHIGNGDLALLSEQEDLLGLYILRGSEITRITLPFKSRGKAICGFGDNSIFITGGKNGLSYLYNIGSESITMLPNTNTVREHAFATRIGNGILVGGGSVRGLASTSCELWVPGSDWKYTPSLLFPRSRAAACAY